MTGSRKEDDGSSISKELEPTARTTNDQPWDPLASIRKTISPTQRLQLLKMQVPILPAEDFMDTVEVQRAAEKRPRRFLVPVLGLAGVLLAFLVVVLWSRFWSAPPPLDESTQRPLVSAGSREVAFRNATPSSATSADRSEPSPPSLEALGAARATGESSAGDPAIAKPRALEVGSAKSLHTASPSPRSKSAPLQATTSTSTPTPTPPNPEPAPSGITFWTQPR